VIKIRIVIFLILTFVARIGYSDNNCDENFSFLSFAFVNICPKLSPESSIDSPKIGVLVKWRHLFGQSDYKTEFYNLSHGQCIFYHNLSAPSIRYCARIANPDLYDTNEPQKIIAEADTGYTKGKHIDQDGNIVDDKPALYEQFIMKDANNTSYENCIELLRTELKSFNLDESICDICQNKNSCNITFSNLTDKPKLCLYDDPCAEYFNKNVMPSGDIYDTNPFYQPLHSGHDQNIATLVQLLSAVATVGQGAVDGITQLLGTLLAPLGGEVLANLIIYLVNILGAGVVDLLLASGKLNAIASPFKGIGICTEFPIGPNPPAYCPTIDSSNSHSLQKAKVELLCATNVTKTLRDSDGNIIEQDLVTTTPSQIFTETMIMDKTNPTSKFTSTPSMVGQAKCQTPTYVYSIDSNKVQNNFINNAVRVSYSLKIPRCQFDMEPINPTDQEKVQYTKDKKKFQSGSCVRINGTVPQEQMDLGLIKSCLGGGGAVPCANMAISNVNTQRPIYRLTTKLKATYNPDKTISTIMVIDGVDIGDYKDVVIAYNDNNIGNKYLTSSVTLNDPDENKIPYTVQLVGDEQYGDQLPNTICIYKGVALSQNKVGCVQRAEAPQLQIYPCKDNKCISTFQNPSGTIEMQIGKTIIAKNIESTDIKTPITIAGTTANIIITDENLSYIPFNTNDTQHVVIDKTMPYLRPDTIIGNYYPKVDASSYDSSNISQLSQMPTIDNKKYLKGLEYYKGEYRYGGKYLCMDNTKYVNCPQNPKDCVLAKVSNPGCTNPNNGVPKDSRGNPEYDKVCVASQAVQDRICPAAPQKDLKDLALTDLVLQDNMCYVPSSYRRLIDPTNPILNPSLDKHPCVNDQPNPAIDDTTNVTVVPRPKNFVEQGLCIEIPQPETCKAIDSGDNSSGFATWDETNYGELANGKCIAGYQGSPTRFCLININDGSTAFDSVQNPCTKIEEKSCEQIVEDGITWPKTKAGETSVAQCIPPKKGSLSRQCNKNADGSVTFSPNITNNCYIPVR
jgi:hypothetical protein